MIGSSSHGTIETNEYNNPFMPEPQSESILANSRCRLFAPSDDPPDYQEQSIGSLCHPVKQVEVLAPREREQVPPAEYVGLQRQIATLQERMS
jgi:hypothetical protein